jgi:hypothetical protein
MAAFFTSHTFAPRVALRRASVTRQMRRSGSNEVRRLAGASEA